MELEATPAFSEAAFQALQASFAQLQKSHIEVLEQHRSLLKEHNAALRQLLDAQRELAQLKKMIFGSKRERFTAEADPQQLSLFETPLTEASSTEPAKQHIEYDRKVTKSHPGRTELPEHLPVVEVVIEPEADTTGMKRIGEEITETLEYTPASLVKKRTIRPKYAKRDGDGVVIGKLPSRPLPKAIAEASLLAHITVSKFVDHLPFHRQIQQFKRDYQWEPGDSTINEWFVAVCTLLHPLYEKHREVVLTSGYLQVDESPIKVLDQDHDKGIHQGYQWVYYAPRANLVYFNYRKGRGQHGPKEILADYQGILQTDGWQVYDKFEGLPGIVLTGCLAHARRYFNEARETHTKKSEEALALFRDIYLKEREGRELPAQERKAWRDAHVRPLFNDLRTWLDEELKTDIGAKSPYAKAVTYLSKQWPKLIRTLDYADVELDNNLIENKIRPLALGRKNYLFAGSHAAAERIAMMYSFFGSCKANGINPYEWLKDTLERIPETKVTDLEKLLPMRKV